MDAGRAVKRDTVVDIPLTYDMPHFITEDTDSEDPLHGHFVLVLQGFLCHRGTKPDSGHYLSAARCNDAKDGEYQWLLNDDLASPRVSVVEDIQSLLKKEKPYLLFYQVEPISALGEPPAYSDSGTTESSILGGPTVDHVHYGSGADTGRNSSDRSLADDSRGRSSLAGDRPKSWMRTGIPADDHKTNGSTNRVADMLSESQIVDDNSKRDSKVSQNGVHGRQTGRNRDKRTSMSLSRMTGRLTKGKSSTSLSGVEHAAAQNAEHTASDGVAKAEATKPSHRKSRLLKDGSNDATDRRECVLM